MKNKQIYIIDLIIIVASFAILLILVYLIGFRNPLVIAPLDNISTTDNSILFSFENVETIYIDDNPEFTSPDKFKVQKDLLIRLEPGIYYWKAQGLKESEVRKLEIKSKIDLKLKELDNKEKYALINAGNTRLKIRAYNESEFLNETFLEISQEKNISGTKFIGSQE